MLSKIHTAGLLGINAFHVCCETDIGDGLQKSSLWGGVRVPTGGEGSACVVRASYSPRAFWQIRCDSEADSIVWMGKDVQEFVCITKAVKRVFFLRSFFVQKLHAQTSTPWTLCAVLTEA